MKLIISIVLCAAILCSVMIMSGIVSSAQTSHEQFSLSTTDLVKEMGAGWNLGNTFEATDRWDSGWSDSFTVNDVETGWGNPTTTQAIFDKVADQGFKSVRIPVSWYRWVDDDNGYKIDSAWMSRVKEIVSYAYAHDMYVIVNMHHDDKDWLDISKTGDEWEAVKEKYQAIWVQIAAEFKDYDEHLLLEGGNEMVADGDWWGHSQYYFDNQNELYQIFVDTVRSSGGNNAKRYLVLPTYGAQWYSHQWGNLVIPNGDSHCIIDIHWYSTNTSEYETYMSAIYNGLVSKGQAVIFGECGIVNSSTDATKENWATQYYGTAKSYGMACFIWDDGGKFSVLNRSALTWYSQRQVDAIINVTSDDYVATTTEPTTALITPDNDGSYAASDTVYYKWSSSWYHKTEGWQTGANNIGSFTPTVKNGVLTIDLSGFKSQQVNTNWSLSDSSLTTAAQTAIDTAKSGSGYLIFTITLEKAKDNDGNDCTGVYIGHNIAGITNAERSVFVKNGETKSILVDLASVTYAPSDFTFKLQQFDEGLTEIKATVSSITVAKQVSASTTATTTTTVKPTTATTTIKPTTATAKTTTATTTTVKPTTATTTAKTVIYGDADGSKSIDVKDVLVMRKYLAKWDVTIDLDAADVNADGKVDTKDVLLLRKYNAHWDVTLGPQS